MLNKRRSGLISGEHYIPALFARHVPQARQMLRKLQDRHMVCEPIMEGGKPRYRFTGTGTFDRLLTGMKVVNDGGGEHVDFFEYQSGKFVGSAPIMIGRTYYNQYTLLFFFTWQTTDLSAPP